MPSYPATAAIRFRTMPMAERAARAMALLAKAGYGAQNPLTFDFNIQNQTDARLIAVALQSMWKEIGAEVRIVPSDDKNHYNLLLKRAFSVAWAGWVADYRDAKDFLLIGQSSAKDLNNGAYANPKFDALIAEADLTGDPVGRGQLLTRAEQLMLDDVALAPVYFAVSRTLVSPAVSGWIDNQININRTRYLRLERNAAAV
jgi:oligopeptide transport system substrate-binding protein